MKTTPPRGATCVAALLSLVGCKELDDAAREHAAALLRCPEAEVTVRPASERPSVLILGPATTPPPSLASLPAQQAQWQVATGNARAALDRSWTALAVSGCGRAQTLLCRYGGGTRGGVDRATVNCTTAAAAAKLAGRAVPEP